MSGLTGVVAIAAGGYRSLAVKEDGTVWEWGFDSKPYVQEAQRSTPAPVGGLSGAAAVAASGAHTLALKGDGTVWSWGGNWAGQLGT